MPLTALTTFANGFRDGKTVADSGSESGLSSPPSDIEREITSTTDSSEELEKDLRRKRQRKPVPNSKKRKSEHMTESATKKVRTNAGLKAVKGGVRKNRSTLANTSPGQAIAILESEPTKTKVTHAKIKSNSTETAEKNESAVAEGSALKKAAKPRKRTTVEEEVEAQQEQNSEGTTVKKVKRKRKTKEEKEAEMLPLAQRTVGSKLFIGAHVSSAGGVHNAVVNSLHIGGNAFALFLKSQRKWVNPPLIDDHCASFQQGCDGHEYDASKHVVPHGSYLVNLCHPDPERTKQAYDAFLDDLIRCNKLGIKLYNFHPGNSAGADSREQAIQHLALNLNKSHADPSTGSVVTLLETMATRGNTIGGTFEDLRDTINLISKKDRVGVCLDTCHVFAAGYDISTPTGLSAVLDHFDATVGLHYLRALHVNDSKAPLSSHRDLHANIGTGFLGLRAFHALVNEPRLWGLPMVLETPIDVKGDDGKEKQDKSIWAREIKLMEEMVGLDVDSDKFAKLEETLGAQGRAERERIADQVKRREEKAKSPKKKRGNKQDDGDDEVDVEDA